jgi:IstB-like ATP binding protein
MTVSSPGDSPGTGLDFPACPPGWIRLGAMLRHRPGSKVKECSVQCVRQSPAPSVRLSRTDWGGRHEAAMKGCRVRCALATKLVNELVEAADEKQLNKTTARYGHVDLLCFDELGHMELDRHGAELLFQVLTEREEKNSVAIASNDSFGKAHMFRRTRARCCRNLTGPAAPCPVGAVVEGSVGEDGYDRAGVELAGDGHVVGEPAPGQFNARGTGGHGADDIRGLHEAGSCGSCLGRQRANASRLQLGDDRSGTQQVLQRRSQASVRPPLTSSDHHDGTFCSPVAVPGQPSSNSGGVTQTARHHCRIAYCRGKGLSNERRKQGG